MEKKIRSITITQYDYIISHVNDEELNIQGHPNHYSEFDRDGHPVKEIRYNRAGEFEEMVVNTYDATGNLVHESYYPVENEIAEEKTYIRNDDGRILRVLKQYQDGSVDTITYEYDETGQLVKVTTMSDEGEIEQVETFTWENGVIVSHVIVDEYGEQRSATDDIPVKPDQTRVTRDEKGQVTREEELDEDGNAYLTINRKYDDEGRADEVDVFVDGRGKAITRHYFLKYEYTFFD